MSSSVTLRSEGSREPLRHHPYTRGGLFVGADLTTVPHSSAYGAAVRLIHLNAITPAGLSSLFGIRVPRTQDLSAVMTFSGARQARFAEALQLPDVPASWNLSAWFPFAAPSTLLKIGWSFRYCPICMRGGYHTNLHQLPWFERCPWHGIELAASCTACGAEICTDANWVVGDDLPCGCGHKRIDRDATIAGTVAPPPGAAEFLDDYVAWAVGERVRAALIAPQDAADPGPALAVAVKLPQRWRQWATRPPGLHTRVWRNAGTPAQNALQTLTELETLRRDRPGFLKLAAAHSHSCNRVAGAMALSLPPQTLSDGEMTLFLAGLGIEAPRSFQPARRPSSAEVCSLVPWRTSVGNFLNLTCVHPTAYRPLVAAIDLALNGRTLGDYHAQARPGEINLLLRCCGDILARGYAEGIRCVLAPHAPELWALGRQGPHLTQPWLMVRREGGLLSSILAVWQRLAVGGGQEAEVILAEDEANRRRERSSGNRRKRKAI
jgi:hypothetical protein